jgi:ElaB/YqjD/DUF883 family membrane-anchored ribosome-binding protein
MVRRMLPVTDDERGLALDDLVAKINHFRENGRDVPVMSDTAEKIFELHGRFKKERDDKFTEKIRQVEITKKKKEVKERLRLLINHFLIIFNMRIRRGEAKPSERILYGLNSGEKSIPVIKNESDLTTLSKAIIDGEKMRVKDGGKPMTEVTAEEIEQIYREFTELAYEQASILTKLGSEEHDLAQIRNEVDLAVKDAWDEIEFYYRKEPLAMKRKSAETFGVRYVSVKK